MADPSDVEQALVNTITAAIYPNGTTSPSAIVLANGTNPNARVFAGWPISTALDADMTAGVVNVSVFAPPGVERNVSRYPRDWHDQGTTTPTVFAMVVGSTVTLGGTVTAGHYVSVLVDNQAWSYAMQAGDTLASAAAALAALIAANVQATATGPAIVIATNAAVTVRTGAPGTVIREVKRQERRFMVSIWAPTNDARQATARVVEPALGATDWLIMPDNTMARLIYCNTNDIDRSGKQSTMCRDINWSVEYATTQVAPGYPITVFTTGLNTADGTPAGRTLTQSD